MPGSVWNNQFSCPSGTCQPNQKAREDKQSCAAVLWTKWSTSGASEKGWGTGRTLNQLLYCCKKTFRVTKHPIIGWVTLLCTIYPYLHIIHLHPFPTLFLYPFTLNYCLSDKEKTHPTTNDWIGFGTPTYLFSSQWQTLGESDFACLAAKALNMPQQSDWVLKGFCILKFSAPIH